ncbi:MAG: hypothetical protein WBL63_08895 [Candidatus Acidiferrum sp.]
MSDRGDTALGTCVGVGVADKRHGLLQRRHVHGARTFENESTPDTAGSIGAIADGLRASWWKCLGQLLDVVLPREQPLPCDGRDFSSARGRNHLPTDAGHRCTCQLRADRIRPIV